MDMAEYYKRKSGFIKDDKEVTALNLDGTISKFGKKEYISMLIKTRKILKNYKGKSIRQLR